MICLHRPFHQVERNIALLALKISEGQYDKEALAQQAGEYDISLLRILLKLLAVDPNDRFQASGALHSLEKLKAQIGVAAGPATVTWQAQVASAEDNCVGPIGEGPGAEVKLG